MKKIGVLTGGADCPGLNSVIRAVVRKAMMDGYVVVGIRNGWQGLIENDIKVLDARITSGILDKGGTILGTSRGNPLEDPQKVAAIAENFKRSGIDALITIGGEVTLKIASEMHRQGAIKVVGVPKSIDNALFGTEYAFGFDTAVNVATECIDRLHTTAESHHRIIVIEVMGLYTGWIALESGIAGGADMILVPEIEADLDQVCQDLKARHRRGGKTFSIIVASEGARLKGFSQEETHKGLGHRFGGIGEFLATKIEEKTGYETRVSVLGHIQRGGAPTAYDRVIGTRFGIKAVELVKEGKFGQMVSYKDGKMQSVDIALAVEKRKTIDPELYEVAKVFFAH